LDGGALLLSSFALLKVAREALDDDIRLLLLTPPLIKDLKAEVLLLLELDWFRSEFERKFMVLLEFCNLDGA
jgi:hypothetical protein